MKKISKILSVFMLFLAVINIAKGQNVLNMVNTLEALRLRNERKVLGEKIQSLTQKYAPFYERFNQVSEELGELYRQESEYKNLETMTCGQKALEAEMNVLRLRRDSIQIHETDLLLDKARELSHQHAKEITKGKEP